MRLKLNSGRMERHHAYHNRNKFRRRPTPLPVVQSLVAGAQAHPRAAAVLRSVFVADELPSQALAVSCPRVKWSRWRAARRRSSPSAGSWISAAMATAGSRYPRPRERRACVDWSRAPVALAGSREPFRGSAKQRPEFSHTHPVALHHQLDDGIGHEIVDGRFAVKPGRCIGQGRLLGIAYRTDRTFLLRCVV